MSIYTKLGKMKGEWTLEKKLYELLSSGEYRGKFSEPEDLGEGMAVVYQNMMGWNKPRFVLNHNKKTAFEWMGADFAQLMTVTHKDIDWKSLKKLPEEAINVAERLSFHFPSFIRRFRNGVAEVEWQLNPDGRYYMDDDGYGMTGDIEINIYGFIDHEGKVVVKFQTIKDRNDLDRLRKEAEEMVKRMGKYFSSRYEKKDGRMCDSFSHL